MMTLIKLIIKSFLISILIVFIFIMISIEGFGLDLGDGTAVVIGWVVLFFIILLAWRTEDKPVEDEKDDKDKEKESD